THEDAQAFTKDVLNHMRERLSDYQEQYGDLYNLEATPAESTSYRLAKHDVARYPDIITASQGSVPYYTNSSHLPVSFTADIFEALDIQDELQTLYTSGTVFHAFLGEKLPSWEAAANLVRKIAENYKLPYYTLSPTYSVCKNHGYLSGEQFTCPECGETAEVYSRITGYYRPVQNWNAGKTQEYKERKEYDIGHSVLRHDGPIPEVKAEPVQETPVVEESAENRAILFATPTCPNCRIACSYLDKAGFAYEKLMAEENADLAIKYGVKQAPTLVIVTGASFEKFAGAGAIKQFLSK
ncbi:MAG: anaerobic ribonucleoside-triphosphate reductase, partial [Candidatus Limivicinus sp.]|nr:anaerobic ribonucleoside-triphosphate reductase [Candidatus Limivicinus sp.]